MLQAHKTTDLIDFADASEQFSGNPCSSGLRLKGFVHLHHTHIYTQTGCNFGSTETRPPLVQSSHFIHCRARDPGRASNFLCILGPVRRKGAQGLSRVYVCVCARHCASIEVQRCLVTKFRDAREQLFQILFKSPKST
eukprot:3781536-Amphidinium_carterae.1